MRSLKLGAGLLSAVALVPAVHAQDAQRAEIDALRAEVATLQARLDALERQVASQAAVPRSASAPEPAAASSSTPAAPTVKTQGGLQVTSADERYSMRIAGRLHYDAYVFDGDAGVPSTTELRRARISLQGKLLEWEYKLEQDFASGNSLDGLRDAWIARDVAGGRLTIGHFKPYRGMEELTSSNDAAMMERSFVSANGLFSGRQYQQGVGWQWSGGDMPTTAGISVFNLRSAGGPRNEGMGVAGRVTWAPVHDEDRTLHVGAWGSREDAGDSSPDLRAESSHGSRRGPRRLLAVTPGASGGQVDAVGLELAGSFGPVSVQSEVSRARFDQALGPAQVLQAWYVQGAWLPGGGHRPYKTGSGVFAAPAVPEGGLWELTARYERADNRDLPGIATRSAVVGVNWYLNRWLRFMFDYTRGEDALEGGKVERLGARSQIVF
ncbi:MAG: porin [Pseudoxanthomonas suwonensis]|nr:porin [Pseudoxanthomonas suwonensis]